MSKAFETARQKGRDAYAAGQKRDANPYTDDVGGMSVTWGRVFRRRWFSGWDAAEREAPSGIIDLRPDPARETQLLRSASTMFGAVKITRDPDSYDPENPRNDPTLEV